MVTICREDFIEFLKKGNVNVLGTSTGCAGMLTHQGINAGMYNAHNKRRVPIYIQVKAEIQNIVNGTNWRTDINNYVPIMIDELTEEEKVGCHEKAKFKKVKISSKEASIEFDENNKYIKIKNRGIEIKRCLYNTSYMKEDRQYRTSYYFGGNVQVGGQNYCYISECIDILYEDMFLPTFFIIYVVKTKDIEKVKMHNGMSSIKKEELEELEEKYGNKNKKKKKEKIYDDMEDIDNEY